MQMSDHGIDLLTTWEGSRPKPYADIGGKQTIGVGHLITAAELNSGTITIDGAAVPWRSGITAAQVKDLLRQDLGVYEAAVNNDVKVPLQQNQFDALVSFTFNEGVGSLASSTLLKDINKHDFADVPAQFRRWNKVNGKVAQGLVNRRENEIKLWLSATGAATTPEQTKPADGPTTTSRPKSYTVQPGDTLASVAAAFGTTVADLADTNNLINPADFKAGRVVTIPS